MLKGTIAINMMGMLVRYVPPEGATVRDAVDYAIRHVFGDHKGLDVHPAQAFHRDRLLDLDEPLAMSLFGLGDMLNIVLVS